MALKPILESLEGLDDSASGLYAEIEEDGRTFYRLDVEQTEGWELANTRGLKRALEQERAKVRDAGKPKDNSGGSLRDTLRSMVRSPRSTEVPALPPVKLRGSIIVRSPLSDCQ